VSSDLVTSNVETASHDDAGPRTEAGKAAGMRTARRWMLVARWLRRLGLPESADLAVRYAAEAVYRQVVP
jgi:hypothetical protein